MPFPFRIHPGNEDEGYMLEALKEAWKAFQRDEVPVGAVLVKDKHVIARGHNQVELLQDDCPCRDALHDSRGVSAGNWGLSETILYCTVEPLRNVRRSNVAHPNTYTRVGSTRCAPWSEWELDRSIRKKAPDTFLASPKRHSARVFPNF